MQCQFITRDVFTVTVSQVADTNIVNPLCIIWLQ